MSPDEARDRGFRASQAWDEFVGPACEQLRQEYMAALTKIAANEPWETAKITKLAVAQRVIDAVEQQIKIAIMNGQAGAVQIDRAAQISRIPEAKRRFL